MSVQHEYAFVYTKCMSITPLFIRCKQSDKQEVPVEDAYSSTRVNRELQEHELSEEEDLSSSGGSRGRTSSRAQRSNSRVLQVEFNPILLLL
jgi:hypothetical protein